ncbi:MAG: hypothetical protein KAR38_01295, partial [Calditrichia bacterium]|nr:hypothetical protein [Calditrichia bacterium]
SFSPLRMNKIKELNAHVKEYLDEFVEITGKGIISLGYLTPPVLPPHLRFYSNLQDEDFKKYLAENNSFITHGRKFVEKKDDIIFVITRSYPVVLYLKIALDEVSVLEKLVKKLNQFGKVNLIGLNKKNKENKKEKYSLLSTAHTYSVPNDTAVLAVKINDYIKIPVHKVMIYIYDILEKNDCIPYDAEFGFPIPSEVIKIASEDLFFDKESPAELSKEIKKVFTLFRFDIDSIFGYPSMLLEKKYNITDI